MRLKAARFLLLLTLQREAYTFHLCGNEFVRDTRLFSASPSWEELETDCLTTYSTAPLPVDIDSVLDPTKPDFSTKKPTFFRERHGWCPYSERVWLALEIAGCDYDTVRIDNTGHGPKPSYWSGNTPQIKWPNQSRNQGESLDLVGEIDERYCDGALQSQDSSVRECIAQFRNIFPKARPSSRAAFLFQYNGDPLWRSTFEDTLQQTNDLIQGPFFCGDQVTAADIAWAPFLERYRFQLPALHAGLDVESPYPKIASWFHAMEMQVPAYACRVAGNASSWRKVLFMAGFGNAGAVPSDIRANVEAINAADKKDQQLAESDLHIWRDYLEAKQDRKLYVAATPGAEAAHKIIRNRVAILKDINKQQQANRNEYALVLEDDTDEILRQLAFVLIHMDESVDDRKNVSREVGTMAAYLDERMCVPRDMGTMSAARIALLATVAR